jgi:hypothetical protein
MKTENRREIFQRLTRNFTCTIQNYLNNIFLKRTSGILFLFCSHFQSLSVQTSNDVFLETISKIKTFTNFQTLTSKMTKTFFNTSVDHVRRGQVPAFSRTLLRLVNSPVFQVGFRRDLDSKSSQFYGILIFFVYKKFLNIKSLDQKFKNLNEKILSSGACLFRISCFVQLVVQKVFK